MASEDDEFVFLCPTCKRGLCLQCAFHSVCSAVGQRGWLSLKSVLPKATARFGSRKLTALLVFRAENSASHQPSWVLPKRAQAWRRSEAARAALGMLLLLSQLPWSSLFFQLLVISSLWLELISWTARMWVRSTKGLKSLSLLQESLSWVLLRAPGHSVAGCAWYPGHHSDLQAGTWGSRHTPG